MMRRFVTIKGMAVLGLAAGTTLAVYLIWRMTESFTDADLRLLIIALVLGYPVMALSAYLWSHQYARQLAASFRGGVDTITEAARAVAEVRQRAGVVRGQVVDARALNTLLPPPIIRVESVSDEVIQL